MPKNIHSGHRERMKQTFLKAGFESFSDIEKLEFLLFYCVPFKDTNPIAHELLDEFKTFNNVINAPFDKLKKVKGIGENSAIFFKALHEFITVYTKSQTNLKSLNTTTEARAFCESLFVGKTIEEIYLIVLNDNNEVINFCMLNQGDGTSVSAKARDIITKSSIYGGNRIILSHNHPNGKPLPSDEDIAFTRRIIAVLTLSEIELLDHIVVSPHGSVSMTQAGIMDTLHKILENDKHIQIFRCTSTKKPYVVE